jgi:hypothetical protein
MSGKEYHLFNNLIKRLEDYRDHELKDAGAEHKKANTAGLQEDAIESSRLAMYHEGKARAYSDAAEELEALLKKLNT